MIDVIPILWANRRRLMISTLIAMVLIALFMLTQKNYYKATALFYPANEALHKPIAEAGASHPGLYGNDRDIDRLLSIGKSHEMMKQLTEELKLYDHYQLEPTNRKHIVKIHKKIKKVFKVFKTEYDAIEVSFEDQSPEKAAQFANSAMSLINKKAMELSRAALQVFISTTESELSQKKNELSDISLRIQNLRQQQRIYNVTAQAEALAQAEIKASHSSTVQSRIKELTSSVAQLNQWETQLETLTNYIVKKQNMLDRLNAQSKSDNSAIHIIQHAQPPVIKSRPHRSLYVLGGGIFVFMISSFALLLLEEMRQMK